MPSYVMVAKNEKPTHEQKEIIHKLHKQFAYYRSQCFMNRMQMYMMNFKQTKC